MSILSYSNNAKTTITATIGTTNTSITVATGTGSLFPASGFYATLSDPLDYSINEIVFVTTRASDVLTVQRHQQGTTAKIWEAGSVISQDITAGDMDNFLQRQELTEIYNPPVGSILPYASQFQPPQNWLWCDGNAYAISLYPSLYSVLGTTYGTAPSGYFFLPNLKGAFVRGANNQTGGYNPLRTVGSVQQQAIKAHNHALPRYFFGGAEQRDDNRQNDYPETSSTQLYTDNWVGSETRPVNIALGYIIRAKLIF